MTHVFLILGCLMAPSAEAAGFLKTNALTVNGAPEWLTERMLEKVTDRIERALEWDIRRVQVSWYSDRTSFEKSHGLGSSVLAYARKKDQTVHVGPSVTRGNFEEVFGHELAHIVVMQKYRASVPAWLEEGLANYAARRGTVDYRWLKTQPERTLVGLSHPFTAASSTASDAVKYHYQASTAAAEMIAARCGLQDLLQLSVGRKLETFLETTCGIRDLQKAFREWVSSKAGK